MTSDAKSSGCRQCLYLTDVIIFCFSQSVFLHYSECFAQLCYLFAHFLILIKKFKTPGNPLIPPAPEAGTKISGWRFNINIIIPPLEAGLSIYCINIFLIIIFFHQQFHINHSIQNASYPKFEDKPTTL